MDNPEIKQLEKQLKSANLLVALYESNLEQLGQGSMRTSEQKAKSAEEKKRIQKRNVSKKLKSMTNIL